MWTLVYYNIPVDLDGGGGFFGFCGEKERGRNVHAVFHPVNVFRSYLKHKCQVLAKVCKEPEELAHELKTTSKKEADFKAQ